MSQFFRMHPDTPQQRLIRHAVEILYKGGVIAYPTDSAYALGCIMGEKKSLDKIRQIRQLGDKHNFSIICRDLSELATYAKVDNSLYRLLKAHTPGAYTFILNATTEVPRRLMHPKRRTIGLRVPEHTITQALLAELGEPLMSTSLIMPGDEEPQIDPEEIRDKLEHQLDLIIDGGRCGLDPTTIVSLTGGVPEIIREGVGDPAPFLD